MISPIGIVKKVFFNKIVIEVFNLSKINQNYLGDTYKCDGIDTFILVKKSLEEKIIYQIIGLYEEEKPFAEENENSKFHSKSYFEAIPIGSLENLEFEYGASRYPMIGDEVFLISEEELNLILSNNLSRDEYIQIGELSNRKGYFPQIKIDDFFTTHVSVLGNTGSGKSTTIRSILKEISEKINENIFQKEKLNFYIFDIHNEYQNFQNDNLVNKISLNNISIPLQELRKEDWLNLVIPSSATQLPVLINSLKLGNLLERDEASISWIKVFCARELYKNQQSDNIAKRAKIIGILDEINDLDIKDEINGYSSQYGNFMPGKEEKFKIKLDEYIKEKIGDIAPREYLYKELEKAKISIKNIENLRLGIEIILLLEESKANTQIRTYCSSLLTRIDNLIILYKDNLFSGKSCRIKRFNKLVEHQEKAFEIIDCSQFENEDLLFFSSFMLNIIYENQKQNRKNGSLRLIHFIFDEAHRYIAENNIGVFNPIKTFEKIAKEGRKFGVFLILASQRPSELSKTVLSQCNNFILHRIRNNIDLEQMRKSIPYISDSQLLRLSYLKTGHALVVGEAFQIQLELKISRDELDDSSATAKPTIVWKF